MPVSYDKLWKILIDKKNESNRLKGCGGNKF